MALAFVFGYAFTFFPLVRSGMALRTALGVTLAADTASITLMEIVDNGDDAGHPRRWTQA